MDKSPNQRISIAPSLMPATSKSTNTKWWQKKGKDNVQCHLCPRNCIISLDKTGYCGIRKNAEGELVLLAYGRPVALQVDPIEKKPLTEFLPGTSTFSIGTYGCNLGCLFCQNYHLSRGKYSEKELESIDAYYSPDKIVELAIQHNCQSVAFTYNEPLICGEYVIDIAKCAKSKGLGTVLVSNAYVSKQSAKEILPNIDAANFDMKGFSEEFYTEMTGSHLHPVLDTIKYFHSTGGHLELTNLVIPNKNDSDKMIDDYLDWVAAKLDKKVPLHFSAFFPVHKYTDSPSTPHETLFSIKQKAEKAGFTSVHLGNIR